MQRSNRRFRIWLHRTLPILQWAPNYHRSDLRGDLSAGLTVGIMLIPQGMAYALLAGVPPIYGLYAGLIPTFIYALFGTSPQLSVGPVAILSLVVSAGLAGIVERTQLPYLELAALLTLMVGVLKVTFGLFRLGFLVNFLSYPVLSGFTSAAAVIIGISQMKHILGVEVGRRPRILGTLEELWPQIPETNLPTLAIAVIGLAVILYLKRVKSLLPAPLLVVVLGILAVWLLKLNYQGVSVVGEVPDGLPPFSIPGVDWELVKMMFPLALTVALIGYVQSIAVAKKVQEGHKYYRINPNQELVALGLSNFAGSFFGSFPVTGGFARTVVNDQAGARTGFASIITAVLIGLTLLFLTPLFYFLPNAILGAIIMGAVINLFDFKTARYLAQRDTRDFLLLVATFLATIIFGITNGILIGVGLSLAMMVYFSTRPHVAELGRIPGTDHFRNVRRHRGLLTDPEVLILRYDAQLYFANAEFFERIVLAKVDTKGKDLKLVVINCYGINHIDSTALNTLREVLETLDNRGIQVYFIGMIGPIRDAFKKYGITRLVGEDHFHISITEALDFYHQPGKGVNRDYVLQSEEEYREE